MRACVRGGRASSIQQIGRGPLRVACVAGVPDRGLGEVYRSAVPKGMANVRSLSDLRKGGGDGAPDSDDDDMNDYYAGGEKSGMVVKGADGPRAGPDPRNRQVVDDLFQSARQMGAREGQPEDLAEAAGGSSSSRGGAFSGTAYTLSGQPASVAGAGSGGPGSAAGASPPPPSMHTITFYRDGVFTVDDGGPRSVRDIENKDFIDSISRGEVPREFDVQRQRTTGPGGLAMPAPQVHVNLVSKLEEEYVPPKYVAFGGQGNRLSASAPSDAGAGPASATLPSQAQAQAQGQGGQQSMDEIRRQRLARFEKKG